MLSTTLTSYSTTTLTTLTGPHTAVIVDDVRCLVLLVLLVLLSLTTVQSEFELTTANRLS